MLAIFFEGGGLLYNHRMKQESYYKNTFFVTHSNQLQIKNYLQKENVNTFNCKVGAHVIITIQTYNIMLQTRHKPRNHSKSTIMRSTDRLMKTICINKETQDTLHLKQSCQDSYDRQVCIPTK